MEFSFFKYSPCGNITVLVPDAEIEPEKRAIVAAEIIAPGHLGAEQAGFVRTEGIRPGIVARLDMMGGEFCLNATRSLAAFLFDAGLLAVAESEPGWKQGVVEVSGAEEPIAVYAHSIGESGHWYEAAVDMLLPASFSIQKKGPGLYLVPLPGITHLVLDAEVYPVPIAPNAPSSVSSCSGHAWKKMVSGLLVEHDLLDAPASGCIWLHRECEGIAITPFVRVRDTNTIYAETSCGSGTVAAALVALQSVQFNGKIQCKETLPVRQPGGDFLLVTPECLNSSISSDGRLCVRVGGTVQLLARGSVFVDCLKKK